MRNTEDVSTDISIEDEEEVAPNPAALIESLRSFGYSPATAIADLIDNSITARATRIDVDFSWSGSSSSATILDNGVGMTETVLRSAMRAGSSNPLNDRSSSDLGRFGLGLKTATFSQARSLTVFSKANNNIQAVRRWDLDYVGSRNMWALLKTGPPEAEGLDRLADLKALVHGTLVFWTKLDRIVDDRPREDKRAEAAFYQMVDDVRIHAQMVFHRFMTDDGLQIYINGQSCEPWDPFLTSNHATDALQSESRSIRLPDDTQQQLVIQPYVLPHRSQLSDQEKTQAAGPRGWNLHQGFYLYRARRLIVAGDWFNPRMKPEEHYKLARIRVEITQDMDSQWDLDVRKSRARPPAALRDDFIRIARATRERAQAVYRHQGRKAVGQAQRTKRSPVWRVSKDRGQVVFEINRQHAVLQHLIDSAPASFRQTIKGALRLIEGNVPVAYILSQGFENEDQLPFEPDAISDDLRVVIKHIFCGLLESGYPPKAAREQLITNQPFDQFPELIEALDQGDC